MEIWDQSVESLTSLSLDGRFLGYGSSDLSIGMLDTKTLSVRPLSRCPFSLLNNLFSPYAPF